MKTVLNLILTLGTALALTSGALAGEAAGCRISKEALDYKKFGNQLAGCTDLSGKRVSALVEKILRAKGYDFVTDEAEVTHDLIGGAACIHYADREPFVVYPVWVEFLLTDRATAAQISAESHGNASGLIPGSESATFKRALKRLPDCKSK